MSDEYHDKGSCNKCGKNNTVISIVSENYVIEECETQCSSCGFKDYWSYGYFESIQNGFNACHKYKP